MTGFTFVVTIAVGIGVVESVKGFFASRTASNPFGWSNAFMGNLPWWILWALLAPLIFRLAERWPLTEGRIRGSAIRHLVVSVVLSVGHLSASALIVWGANVREIMPLSLVVRNFLTGYFIPDILTYWLIAVAYSAYNWRNALRVAVDERHRSELRAARAETKAVLLQAQANEARLSALRLELNPHFLFNALNSVSALARSGESARATMVLSRLSDLLRETLEADGEVETILEDELRLVSKYVEIERVRFGERLQVEIEAAPAVGRALLPSFSIQPLVENAIRHGVGAARGPVAVSIKAFEDGTSLQITVSDSAGVLAAPAERSDGVGLGNTRARLQTLYGEQGSLELATGPGGSTNATMRIPLRIDPGIHV